MKRSDLPSGTKKAVKVGNTEILLINLEGQLMAVESKCPHAGAPLAEGAVCNGRLVCPWHMGAFALPGGALVEPPPMRALKTYPVAVEGEDIVVSAEPQPAGEPMVRSEEIGASPSASDGDKTDARRFVLVGAGAAGAMAARSLRLLGFRGTITAIDPLKEEPVDRTALSKVAMSGQKAPDKIPLGTMADDKVERLVASVTKLSAANRTVTLNDGRILPFDAALVATGGTPLRPKIAGAEHGFVLRHTADLKAILKEVDEAAKRNGGVAQVVVLGTSFIGMEAAAALTQRGAAVTVTGKPGTPFAEKFGDRVGQAVENLHRSSGVQFRLDGEVTRIAPDSVTLETETGTEELPADLVLLGTGIEPAVGFEHDLPAAPPKRSRPNGLAVTTSLQAGPGVWVAGDIANVDGRRIEHWRLAEQHGEVAARAMLGSSASYTGVPYFWTAHFGKRLAYLGHAEAWDEIHYEGDVESFEFLAFYVQAGKIAAVLSCGRTAQTALLSEAMRSPLTLQEALAAIA